MLQVWVLEGDLSPGRDDGFHYPNISNFSLQFWEAESFWPPTLYQSLELIICLVKFRDILIRIIELSFSGLLQASLMPQSGVSGPDPLSSRPSLQLCFGACPPGVLICLRLCLWRSLWSQGSLSTLPRPSCFLGFCLESVPSWLSGEESSLEAEEFLQVKKMPDKTQEQEVKVQMMMALILPNSRQFHS